MFGYRSAILMGAAVAVAGLQTASGQEDYFQRDRNVAVLDRPQPEFDPEPIRLGSFQARSSFAVGGYYVDNVFATDQNEVSDFAFTFRPTVDVASDWSRHEVGLNVTAERFEFIDQGSESVTNAQARLRGRADVNRDWYVTSSAFVRQRNEPRTQISILDDFGEPVELFQYGGDAFVNYERSRIRGQLGYEYVDTDFDDVQGFDPSFPGVDQDFRDVETHTVRGRLSYAVTRDYAVFVQGSYFERDFDTLTELSPGVFAVRDSDGFTIEGGINFELQGPFRGDVAVGYLEEDRESPLFGDIEGLSVDGRLQWFPTRLTTVTASASRRTTDVGLVNAAAATSTSGNLRVDHELLRNVLLYAQGGIFETDFSDADRDDTFFDVGFGSVYKINKRVHLEGFYRYTNRDSSVLTEEFSQNIVGFEITLFP
ncbi:MAG: outer membrane beta-barrel protein [Pseudomonadota bacterium]